MVIVRLSSGLRMPSVMVTCREPRPCLADEERQPQLFRVGKLHGGVAFEMNARGPAGGAQGLRALVVDSLLIAS